jgi:hypothetical protein
MSLSDLASVGSFISGAAVVVTLIFLVFQMQQTNRNQRALMQQMRSARTVETQLRASEPYVAEAMNRAFANDVTMNDTQVRTFLMICIASVTNWEDSFFQHRSGAMEAASFASDVAILKVFASLPAFRAIWPTMRDWIGEDIRAYVDQTIREIALAPAPLNIAAVWRENLAKELAAAT